MNKLPYASPELDIRWFESEDVIAYSVPDEGYIPGEDVNPDEDEW